MIHINLNIQPPTATTQSSTEILRRGRGPNAKTFVGKKRSKWLCTWLKEFSLGLLPSRPRSPLLGPISVSYVLVYPYRTHHKKKLTKEGALIWKPTRPDCDNTVKAMTDTLGKTGYFKDDGQIVDLRIRKMHGPTPMIKITIEELGDVVEPF